MKLYNEMQRPPLPAASLMQICSKLNAVWTIAAKSVLHAGNMSLNTKNKK
jgi:hypothetical protein